MFFNYTYMSKLILYHLIALNGYELFGRVQIKVFNIGSDTFGNPNFQEGLEN